MKNLARFTEELSNDLSFEMIWVEGGGFMMGNSEKDAEEWELPIHKVQVSGFFLGKFPLTQDIWIKVMGNNALVDNRDSRPVDSVSWNDVQGFIQKLNRIKKRNYRLPTEAEWEYAARGGKHSEGYLYAGSDKMKEVGWCSGYSGYTSHPVGKKAGNELGLYDMSGNVWEWVEDQYHYDYNGAPFDGSAWVDSNMDRDRILRGGSWNDSKRACRVSNRSQWHPSKGFKSVGFRLALSR